MDRSVRWFLRSAVLWLLLGLGLGVWMALAPGRMPLLRAAHLHALLPGFILFMIFGVGYHILPRFSGRPLPWPRGALVHLALANLGVGGLVAGFPARVLWPAGAAVLIPLGGALVLAGAALFAHATWTLTGVPTWQRQPTKGRGTPPSAST
jgi:cbb3-type cytochrome oxidase subunit 1